MSTRRRLGPVFHVLGTACGLLAIAVSTPAQEPARTYAITGARVTTVSGPVLENATIVIANGRILSVGGTAPVPAGAEVIDGKGLDVAPGFFVGTLAVALGLFLLLRLLGRLLIENWMGKTRRGATGAHIGVALFLVAVGIAYLQQTAWVVRLFGWMKGL